ncbi:hypothetical protein ACIBI4_24110 [Streptomyces sp. NPDC050418]|uniref:hypothetical protein n=1 Tax=Streptomyces sp. NPDC050418 TaxID=3365612 RepID=UPI0037B3DDD5
MTHFLGLARLRLLPAALVLGLLSPLSACSLGGSGARCVPADANGVSTDGDLVGTYKGERDAKGVRLTLEAGTAQNEGKASVRNWPTGDYHRDALGETFNGTGTWSVDWDSTGSPQNPVLQLDFEKPDVFAAGDTLDRLSIAADSDRTVFAHETDPDMCPKFRLERQRH